GRTRWRASSWFPGPEPGCVSCRPYGLIEDRREHAPDDRPSHRYPRVAPVRIPLARDRQERVREPGTQIARRVDRVAGRPAQRQADGPHEDSDQERAEPRVQPGARSEEHTSELQSHLNIVCRLLLEKNKSAQT